MRACSRAIASARAPSRRLIASTSAWCWYCATRRISHDSGSAACTISRALGGANGRASTCSSARPSCVLFASSRNAWWNSSLSRRYSRKVSTLCVRTTASSSRQRVAQRLELVLRLEPLRREARSRALEHSAKLDRVVDVGTRELAHHEAAAGERLEEPFVLERHERDPERCPRDAELLDETKLGNALARLEHSVEQELAEPERRLRRLRVRVVPAWHEAQRNRRQPYCVQSRPAGSHKRTPTLVLHAFVSAPQRTRSPRRERHAVDRRRSRRQSRDGCNADPARRAADEPVEQRDDGVNHAMPETEEDRDHEDAVEHLPQLEAGRQPLVHDGEDVRRR